MNFFHPHLLWLAAVPLLLLAADLLRRGSRRDRAPGKILAADAGPAGVVLRRAGAALRGRVRWRLALGLALAAAALARPQWGRVEEPVFDQAREIIVAIDLSRSMLADDVKPTRLERARLLTQSLLENTPGERVGLVVFAGTAFLQSPLSADHEIIRDFLPQLNPDFLPAGGTDYRALLRTALDAFSASAADRFLIVLSDGEAASDDWKKLVAECKEHDVRVLTLGIGTHDGSMLPDGQGGLVKDQRGAVVLSKLDDSTLRDLARETDGVYTDASQWVDLAALIDATVAQGRRGDFQETGHLRLIERYQWLLGPALFLLLWSLWREFPVRVDSRRVGRLRAAAALAGLLALVLGHAPSARAETATEDLPALVTRLSAQPALSADDLADLAQRTIDHAESLKAQGQSIPPGAVSDALAAVKIGQSLNSKAAHWDQLAEELEKLLEPPPEQKDQQKQPAKDQQQQQQQSDDQKKSDQSDSDQSSGQQGKSDDKSGQNSEQSSDQQQQQQQQQNQGDSSGQNDQNGDPSKASQTDQNKDDQSGDPSSGQQPKDKKSDKQGRQAFGDMQSPNEQPKPDQTTAQPQPAPGEEKTPDQGDTQRVGGAATGQPSTNDPALMQTLQRLEQLKGQDSPARLFQLLQDPKDQPAAPAGQTW